MKRITCMLSSVNKNLSLATLWLTRKRLQESATLHIYFVCLLYHHLYPFVHSHPASQCLAWTQDCKFIQWSRGLSTTVSMALLRTLNKCLRAQLLLNKQPAVKRPIRNVLNQVFSLTSPSQKSQQIDHTSDCTTKLLERLRE